MALMATGWTFTQRTIVEGKMKLVLYVRVSSDPQEKDKLSLEEQITIGRKWANERGHTIIEVFEDRGASASSLAGKNPEFERMIRKAFSKPKPFDIIALHIQARFYSKYAGHNTERELAKNGVRLVILGVPEVEMSSYLAKNILGIMDEMQRVEISNHIWECKVANARAGFYNGSIPPYGYKIQATDIPTRTGVKKILVVDEDEASIVRRIFELAQFGRNGMVMGMKGIAEELNDQGALHRSAKWTSRHVANVLKNSVCVGKLVTYRRSSQPKYPHPYSAPITTEVPPILDKAVFNAVQMQLATRRPSNTKNRTE